ncbi:hypothetical protein [Flavobacterium lacus]|uniref:Uncharacterized protein n=1 Tax=Flavobacterium lacus TaxID=1353778 RepID=A0A328WXR1_9FLAO|nr:hypothetical protein [Flavobacterium lacus]RAR51071.1 hypothetical protein B0I10_101245 [Flavobacterium lacus]
MYIYIDEKDFYTYLKNRYRKVEFLEDINKEEKDIDNLTGSDGMLLELKAISKLKINEHNNTT